MCGIAGVFKAQGTVDSDTMRKMATVMQHRGPDDSGLWVDDCKQIGLSHRRLSILDLSGLGHQPMRSNDGRYVITYNGELYNFKAIREQLAGQGFEFRSETDTEVILSAFEAWGVEKALTQFNGMFAIGLWDAKARALYLIRDRLGIKPLYYAWTALGLAFASELKAFRTLPEFDASVDRDVLALYLRHNYVPGPYCIYKSAFKLQPGCWLRITQESLETQQLNPVPYWNMDDVANRGSSSRTSSQDDAEAIEHLDTLLKDSVKQRMIADVPLGAFLSGGIDSSLVVALMQAQSSRAVETFSIGFEEATHNEADFAREVAQHLGTKHTNFCVTAKECQDEIPKLPHIYDEPFADASQIATSIVSQLARKHVTVCLSGDGGDELFCGYKRYFSSTRFWKLFGRYPHRVRRLVGNTVLNMPRWMLEGLIGWTGPKLNHRWGYMPAVQRYRRLAHMLIQPDFESSYSMRHSLVSNPHKFLFASCEPKTAFNDSTQWSADLLPREHMMLVDAQVYLPDDILVKVDRASMACGLEARVPLLDHRVVEYAWQLPMQMKYRDGHSKWLLKQVLKRYVPEALFERPKMGFRVPVGQWIKGPLRDWAEALLSTEQLERDGFFRKEPVRRMWREHLSGRYDWENQLWGILMFKAWWDEQHKK